MILKWLKSLRARRESKINSALYIVRDQGRCYHVSCSWCLFKNKKCGDHERLYQEAIKFLRKKRRIQ